MAEEKLQFVLELATRATGDGARRTAEDFITLGMLPRDVDRARVVPALTSVFAEALRGGVSNLSFGDLSANLGETCLLLALPLALRGQPSRWLRADRAPHP